MGLGVAGGAVEDALFFIKHGARLTITDTKTKKDLAPSLKRLEKYDVTYHLGGHQKKDFIDTDLVIKNPAVPDNSIYLQIAKDHGVAIDTSIGIFGDLVGMRFLIGITGTKGKSTTATLMHDIIKTKYKNAYLAGNIGASPLKYINKKGAWGVLELSSWQLEGMAQHKHSPHIALITNIQQDHLNRYKNYKQYQEAKKLIFKYQKKGDILILNYDDPYLRKIYTQAPSRVFFYSAKTKPRGKNINIGSYFKDDILHVKNTRIPIKKLHMKSTYHRSNVVAALTIAQLLAVSIPKALKSIENFKGLEGRLERVATIEHTTIYNDTTATNPYATISSLEVLGDKKIALILGGEDKKLDYRKLAKTLKKVGTIILLPGSASDKIKRGADTATKKRIHNVSSLQDALELAYRSNPQVILFSPAAASFNMFKNEFDRGAQFNREVKKLQKKLKKK